MSHNPHPYNRAIPAGYELRQKKPWYKKAGCIVPLAIVAALLLFMVGCTAIFGKAFNDVANDMDKEHTVTYKIGGNAQDASVIYNTGETNTAQDTGVASGWTKDVTVKGFFGADISATNGAEDNGKISCSIIANGKTISKNTASGSLASANCNASSDDIKKAFEQ